MAYEQEEYRFISGDEYLTLTGTAETWLIEPLIPAGGWVNLYGKPKKARKSYLALGMAHAISVGLPKWLGFELRECGPVIYLQADTPRNLWRERCEHIASTGEYDFSNVFFADSLSMPRAFNIFEDAHLEVLKRMIDAVVAKTGMDPAMVVLDTSRKIHQGNENDNGEMSIFMGRVEDVVGNMAKLLVSHDKKVGNLGKDAEGVAIEIDLMEGNRGATAVAGAVDTVIRLTTEGRMDFQGRATAGEERKQLRFERVCRCDWPQHKRRCPGFMWIEDGETVEETIKRLLRDYPKGGDSALARLVMEKHEDCSFEATRSIIRRIRERAVEEADVNVTTTD